MADNRNIYIEPHALKRILEGWYEKGRCAGSEIFVICLGSAHEVNQQLPNFVLQSEKKVSIINIDVAYVFGYIDSTVYTNPEPMPGILNEYVAVQLGNEHYNNLKVLTEIILNEGNKCILIDYRSCVEIFNFIDFANLKNKNIKNLALVSAHHVYSPVTIVTDWFRDICNTSGELNSKAMRKLKDDFGLEMGSRRNPGEPNDGRPCTTKYGHIFDGIDVMRMCDIFSSEPSSTVDAGILSKRLAQREKQGENEKKARNEDTEAALSKRILGLTQTNPLWREAELSKDEIVELKNAYEEAIYYIQKHITNYELLKIAYESLSDKDKEIVALPIEVRGLISNIRAISSGIMYVHRKNSRVCDQLNVIRFHYKLLTEVLLDSLPKPKLR